ncbi:GNAT family N-acetyltransferase [Heyndrickxia sporothermodurans]
MEIISTDNISRSIIKEFFNTHWGSPQMVISSGVFHCDELDGFAVVDGNGEIIGLITYIIKELECEIISLDSIVERKGIGTKLIKRVESVAEQNQCKKIKLVTTNDNLHALAFYQKRGYHLAKLYANAVENARQYKPSIPLIADNGIPIRDELLLEKELLKK